MDSSLTTRTRSRAAAGRERTTMVRARCGVPPTSPASSPDKHSSLKAFGDIPGRSWREERARSLPLPTGSVRLIQGNKRGWMQAISYTARSRRKARRRRSRQQIHSIQQRGYQKKGLGWRHRRGSSFAGSLEPAQRRTLGTAKDGLTGRERAGGTTSSSECKIKGNSVRPPQSFGSSCDLPQKMQIPGRARHLREFEFARDLGECFAGRRKRTR